MEELETIEQKVHNVVLSLLTDINKDELLDDKDFFSLGLDSINITMLVWKLEEAFGIELRANDISYENFRTIGNTIELIKTKVSIPNSNN